MNTVDYHIRVGAHSVTACDWDRLLNFADQHFGRRKQGRRLRSRVVSGAAAHQHEQRYQADSEQRYRRRFGDRGGLA